MSCHARGAGYSFVVRRFGWFCSLLFWPVVLFADDTAASAARFICDKVAAAGSESVAIFPFTDGQNAETADTRRMTTRVLSGVLECKLRVIDQSKIKDVMREQMKRQSGLYAEESIPEIGRLAGADTLVYGTLDDGLALRMVDARTGEMIGAVVTGDKAAQVADAREELQLDQLNTWLEELSTSDPELFVYVTSSKEEFARYVEANPEAAGRVLDRVEALPPEKLGGLKRMKTRVRELITRYPRAKTGVRRLQKRVQARAARREQSRPGAPVQRLRRADQRAPVRRADSGKQDGASGRSGTRSGTAKAGRASTETKRAPVRHGGVRSGTGGEGRRRPRGGDQGDARPR